VLRIAEVGLSIAIWIAALAFGGTSPPFFLVTEVIILGLGVFFLSASLRAPLTDIRLPLAAPVALIALVVAQILPLPAFLAPLYASTAHCLGGRYSPYAQRCSVSDRFPPSAVGHLLDCLYLVLLACKDRGAKKRLVYTLVALGAFEAFYGLCSI